MQLLSTRNVPSLDWNVLQLFKYTPAFKDLV